MEPCSLQINGRPYIGEDDLVRLPLPVQRYLRVTGITGRQVIRTVRLAQKGFFRGDERQRWLPFTAQQIFSTDPPAFVWRARVRIAPLINVMVTDEFTDGHGKLEARILSLIKVAEASGPQTDQGQLLRFLAEMAWFPTAWVSPWIAWECLDQRTVRATLSVSGTSASAVLHFDDMHRLCRVTAQRFRLDGKNSRRCDWSGEFGAYQRVNGMLVPLKAIAAWHPESGDFEYFRGEVTAISYNP